MSQNGVVPDLIDRPGGQLEPGSKLPGSVAKVTDADKFVGCKEVLDAIGEMLGNVSRVVGEGLRGVARLPASRQGLR